MNECFQLPLLKVNMCLEAKIKILFRQRHSFWFCFQVWLCTHWCLVSRCVPRTRVFAKFSFSSWPLTCICFCGCDVWVTAGIAFSRGPRALSLPSELIIYSIYKTLYVQNRKICKRNRTHGRRSDMAKQFSFLSKHTHSVHLPRCYNSTWILSLLFMSRRKCVINTWNLCCRRS